MQIENSFTVAQPPEPLWATLLDVEKIVPCMPGAELTDVVDDTHWKGKLNAKFGPVSMSFAGTVVMEDRDDAAHRVVLRAKGMEQRGKGAADASVTSWLEAGPSDGETTVHMQADITLSGAAAQMSRGLLPEISKKLTQQFADCLQQTMAADASSSAASAPGQDESAPARTPTPAPAAAKPVGGVGLGLSAIWAVIAGFFRRLFGRGHRD